MVRQEFVFTSGVLSAECVHHGSWFEPGELDHIARVVDVGGLEHARRARSSRARRRAHACRRMRRRDRREAAAAAAGARPLLGLSAACSG
jgi:hypothetical protein